LAILAVGLRAEVIDRIAVVVDHQVITELQLDEELRVTALLNRAPITRDKDARQKAIGRLIEQALVRREMDLSQYPFPGADQVEVLFSETAKQFGGLADLNRELSAYTLTADTLKEHLQFQLMMLKFIDLRFRPDVDVTEADIVEYYNRELVKWKQTHKEAPPTLAASRPSILKAISDQRVDNALSGWLKQTRREANIIFLDKELS
jgi:hypothetical protein